MAATNFNGPVRSQNGFQTVSIDATTGAVTVTATLGPNTSVSTLTTSGVVIMTGLPVADPLIVGALWNDAGTLKVSAG